MGNYIYTPEEGRVYSRQLFGLLADGALRVNVHAEYPFTADGVRQAQRDLVGGKTTGKLIVKVAPEDA